ncbi:exonuclease SbcCD subunit D [bacterium]|nr:exonuclease SbcCD subunit D [bacterium]MCB2178998.1 exonuclease SbcCD subunit D [bacterium]
MVRILHFADAHINMANYGRQDPETGLPMRVVDFLKSLDEIVDTAINEKVDLVIFAGDAYKDRNPAPTFQREWGRRIMKLARAEVPVVLLVGNHDLSPSISRAHALEEFNTLGIERVIVADAPKFYGPDDLWGLPVQLICLPWISRSGMVAYLDLSLANLDEINVALESKIGEIVDEWLEKADPDLPVVMTAHASIQGAVYGGERTVMLGKDMVLSGQLVKDSRLDYVAMGHIHKNQDLNEGQHPPVVYPGSIERVDFGEAKDKKYFVIVEVEKGHTKVDWRELKGIRRFIDRYYEVKVDEQVTEQLRKVLPEPEEMRDAIVRLTVEYPRDWERLIDDAALREIAAESFEFHLVKRPQMQARIRLPEDQHIGSLTPDELLDYFWKSEKTDSVDPQRLQTLAREVISQVESGDTE